jgi:dTDP-4-dehydrorhamnose 3,5-epimerase
MRRELDVSTEQPAPPTWPGGEPGRLDGVKWGRLAVHPDDRGSFREVFRSSWSGEGFVQANLSTSRAGVLRGLHYHRRQLDRWTVLAGRVFVALVDLRSLLEGGTAGSPARPAVETRECGPGDWVMIPAGVAHGFYAFEPADLLYFVTNEYDGSDELGLAWDDQDAAVPWPDPNPILSDRDRANTSLRQLTKPSA